MPVDKLKPNIVRRIKRSVDVTCKRGPAKPEQTIVDPGSRKESRSVEIRQKTF